MAFIRRVRTASGATAVQIAEYAGGRQRIVKHVGSAHTEAELGVLLERARDLLSDPGQAMLDLGVEPTSAVADLVSAGEAALLEYPGRGRRGGRDGAGRVVSTGSRVLFDALAGVYTDLGFDVLGEETFRDLVIARIVEPTSLLDSGRVLTDLARHAKGHLLANQLGGSRTERKNLVTLFQNPVNSPIMRRYENRAAKMLKVGQDVRYTSIPIYSSDRNPIGS